MNDPTLNPYLLDTNEHQIWETLVRNDFEGFLNNDWNLVKYDYLIDGFFGIDFQNNNNPNNWKLNFPSLISYKKQWLKDAQVFQDIQFADSPRLGLYASCSLEQIQIQDDTALVHKVFDGYLPILNNDPMELKWRSLFLMREIDNGWKIAGFCGYIKLTNAA